MRLARDVTALRAERQLELKPRLSSLEAHRSRPMRSAPPCPPGTLRRSLCRQQDRRAHRDCNPPPDQQRCLAAVIGAAALVLRERPVEPHFSARLLASCSMQKMLLS